MSSLALALASDHAGSATEENQSPADDAPRPLLYRHALESVFGFLSLPELSRVLAVSRSWSFAVKSMRSIGAQIRIPALRSGMHTSALARHVAVWDSNDLTLDVPSLSLLTLHMRSLTSLHCRLQTKGIRVIEFPPKLIDLTLVFGQPMEAAADINNAIESVSRLPLLQSLCVWLYCEEAQQLNFTPLQSLPKLEEFAFAWPGVHAEDRSPTDEQIEQVRALPHLLRLNGQPSMPLLCRLLRTPHALKWQSLGASHQYMEVNAELGGLLAELPSLTQARVILLPDCDPTFLTHLRNLTHLHLELGRCDSRAMSERAALSLQGCKQITQFMLSGCKLNAQQIGALLANFERLNHLTLSDIFELESLQFLSTGTLPRTLTNLSLQRCRSPRLHSTELAHVHTLQSLTDLEVRYCFAEPMDRSLYDPPSKLMPNLVKFAFSGLLAPSAPLRLQQ